MGRLSGKVAFVTGAARGQGRAQAIRLAEDGADVVICDICAPIATTNYPPATPEDLVETVRLVEKTGRRIVSRQADVRDLAALRSLVADAIAELGRLDIVVANAGIDSSARAWEITVEQWRDVIDVNLTGVFYTLKASVPAMIELGNGGSIVIISSTAGRKGLPFKPHYVAAKHGLVGLARTFALELGEYDIRVNTVHPAGVRTAIVTDPRLKALIDEHAATLGPVYMNTLPHDFMDPEDAAAVVAWLASDEARFITGAQIPVDMGNTAR